MSRPLEAVHVVVPARNEEAHLPACLDAIATAAARLREDRPGLEVATTVVLDACTDRSADVLARCAWVDTVTVDLRAVGAVRAVGVRRARGLFPHAASVRVVCTDADSTVPPDWLRVHAELAARFDVVAGTVLPDDEVGGTLLRTWLARHHLADGHPHVHGANLGVDLATYEHVGGFAPLATGEDVDLERRLRAAGATFHASGAVPVRTSGRRLGRAPAGFAGYLLSLGGA